MRRSSWAMTMTMVVEGRSLRKRRAQTGNTSTTIEFSEVGQSHICTRALARINADSLLDQNNELTGSHSHTLTRSNRLRMIYREKEGKGAHSCSTLLLCLNTTTAFSVVARIRKLPSAQSIHASLGLRSGMKTTMFARSSWFG